MLLVAMAAGWMVPSEVWAQSEPTVHAVRIQPGDIRIDGRLDEPAWDRAPVADGFTQTRPRPGAAPSQRTEVRVLYDDANLYVGIRLFDDRPDLISAPLARRGDREVHSDWVHVAIDSRRDRSTAFGFSVNPRGIQRDVYVFDDSQQDESWVGVWEAAATIDSLGWAAEYRIPFSQLRFHVAEGEAITWGFQVMRDIAREGERSSWAPWSWEDPGFASRFGRLEGLAGLRAPHRLEIVPYVSPRMSSVPGEGPDARHTTAAAEAGVDLRVGLPRALTLSATVNPDFGQVEADPAEVNLSAFETFFPEQRPFFVEGADAFRFGETRVYNSVGLERYLYSRRIGRTPQLSLHGAGYADLEVPTQTRILAAAKVSGRTPDGWLVGVMNALTARERARFVDDDGQPGSVVVEPLTNYTVGRARKEFREGATTAGALVTATNRDLDGPLDALLHREAYVVGADVHHTWSDRAWSIGGHLAASRVAGSPGAVAATQRSSLRYLQRPDAEHLAYDPDRTSLTGHLADLSLTYTGQWLGSVQLKQISPGFEISDLGFQTRSDARSMATLVGRRLSQSSGPFRDQFYFVGTYHSWNLGGDPILAGAMGSAEVTFTNHWRFNIMTHLRPPYLSDRLTRGGPAARLPEQRQLSGWVESDPRRRGTARLFARYWGDESGARERELGLRLTLQPMAALRAELWPRVVRVQSTGQYVLATDAPDLTTRYVFADLDHTTWSAQVRLDWTFSPTMSLQFYGQPFLSAGSYSHFKEFATPRSFDFDEYGADRGTICLVEGRYYVNPDSSLPCPASPPPDHDGAFPIRFGDPDFNVRSLRTNLVLRWEYRPGSTLFVVWQQDRSGAAASDLALRSDLGELMGDPGRHVVLLKATYWFGR